MKTSILQSRKTSIFDITRFIYVVIC